MNPNPLLAHPEQSLAGHLSGVAQLASDFAGSFCAASKRRVAGEKTLDWFTQDDWRKIRPWIVALDSRSKDVQAALCRYSEPAFAPDDGLELRIWRAGNTGYIGGSNGTGINFDDLDQATRDLLTGGL